MGLAFHGDGILECWACGNLATRKQGRRSLASLPQRHKQVSPRRFDSFVDPAKQAALKHFRPDCSLRHVFAALLVECGAVHEASPEMV